MSEVWTQVGLRYEPAMIHHPIGRHLSTGLPINHTTTQDVHARTWKRICASGGLFGSFPLLCACTPIVPAISKFTIDEYLYLKQSASHPMSARGPGCQPSSSPLHWPSPHIASLKIEPISELNHKLMFSLLSIVSTIVPSEVSCVVVSPLKVCMIHSMW